MDELKMVYLKKLEKMASIEEQIIEALPKMAQMATSEDLKDLLTAHLEETRTQSGRIAQLFEAHSHTPATSKDTAFEKLLSETEKELAEISDPMVKDAAIIASSQVVEHIEMAKYGTLIEWAKVLGDDKGEALLKDTYGEEEGADKKLSAVAKGGLFKDGVNEKAAA